MKTEKEINVNGYSFEALVMPREFNGENYFLVFLEDDDDNRLVFFYRLKENDLFLDGDVFKDIAYIISETEMRNISDAVIAYVKANWSPWKS
jgi:hypothetical protein